MYSFLNNIHNLRKEEGEAWKSSGDEETDNLRRVGSYRFETATLPIH